MHCQSGAHRCLSLAASSESFHLFACTAEQEPVMTLATVKRPLQTSQLGGTISISSSPTTTATWQTSLLPDLPKTGTAVSSWLTAPTAYIGTRWCKGSGGWRRCYNEFCTKTTVPRTSVGSVYASPTATCVIQTARSGNFPAFTWSGLNGNPTATPTSSLHANGAASLRVPFAGIARAVGMPTDRRRGQRL